MGNLEYKTHRDNELDKKAHGTCQVGSINHFAVLHESQIPVVRLRLAVTPKIPRGSIAKEFGVSVATINLIGQRKIWRHVS